ncbi:MAG: relaxase domain-containing protein [Actinomycetota bacterium]|nr:relaxase domain-containing protein [Actinomycetota bacterium]
MVGITKVQRPNARYWIEAVAEGGEDYYEKPGEAPGEWLGELAAELGLEGQIDRAAYTAILAGRDPENGEDLVHRPPTRSFTDSTGRQRTKEPVLAYDVRFAAPKSVSLIYALGDEQTRAKVLAAHDRAVSAGISCMEQQACFVQRGAGGKQIERGEGFVAMAFRHRMSRAGDPALHTHVLVSNMTRAQSDGRWLSLAAPKGRSALYQHGKAAGYVFQAQLRAELTRELGVEWTQTRNGYADIEGIERPVIEHFSQRRAEIQEALAERGVSGPKAAEVAAYRTREAKDYGVDPDQRRVEWAVRAAEFDLSRESIAELISERSPRPARGIRDADLAAALEGLESTRSHFDRRDLICALADQLPEGAELSSLSWAADYVLAGDEVISLGVPIDPSQPAYFTTPRIWAAEQRFCEIARSGQDSDAGKVSAQTLEAVLARHRYLGADQAEMVRRLTRGGERIVPVAARPGAGKTTALAAAAQAWEAQGYDVIGVATARTASGELADIGVPSTSIAALLNRAAERRADGAQPLARGTVIVMDEASTTSTLDAAALAELVAGCEGKLVAIGDPRQIGAVGPGGLFGHLTQAIEPSLLTEIRRQRHEVDRRIVELAHSGRGSDALDLLRAEGRLAIADTIEEARRAVVLDWYGDYAGGADAVMIARRNRDVSDLNAAARDILLADGGLGGEAIRIAERDFAVGDLVLTRINSSEVSNRERWQITAIDAENQTIELQRLGGDERSVSLGPDCLHRYTDSGDPALQYAYALTVYGTQSKTSDSAYVLLDGGANQEEFVVAVSRARDQTRVYGVASIELTDPELGPGRREIEDELSELRAAAERPAADFPALELRLREQIASQDPGPLARRAQELSLKQGVHEHAGPTAFSFHAIDSHIEAELELLRRFAEQRERLESRRWPDRLDRQELRRVKASREHSIELLERLQAERAALIAEQRHAKELRPPLFAEERLELALSSERLDQLRRRAIAAERLAPSPFVREALGERPTDARKLSTWNEGVAHIYSYRQRHGVRDPQRALGAEPTDLGQRDTWRTAQRHLSSLGFELGQRREREIERGLGLERSLEISR